jgi:hypothetical protein
VAILEQVGRERDDASSDPRDVALLGAPTVVADAQRLAYAVEKPGRAGFTATLTNDGGRASITVVEG